jgi:hypothetical protein
VRKPLKILSIVALAACLTACIEVSTVVKVNPDGSGFIEEKVLISRLVMEQFGGMIQGMAEGFGATQEGAFEFPGLFDEAQLQAKASQFGQGVQYVSGEELISDTGEGYRAVYYFPDINLLRIDQNPGEKMGDNSLASLGSVPEQVLTFQLEPGNPNNLIARMPRASQESGSDETESPLGSFSLNEAAPDLNPQMLAMFKNLFQDMRMAMYLQIRGSITATNATHLDGSTITIMELDFGELLADPSFFSELQSAQITSLEDAQTFLQDMPGIKMDLNDELIIEFQ